MRVSTRVADHRETPVREKMPINQVAQIVRAEFERVTRPSFTNQSGELVPERTNTVAVIECVLPDSPEPTKIYRSELGCGDKFVPSADGTYLEIPDEAMTNPEDAKINTRSGWSTFLRSLAQAGAESGTYGDKEDAAVNDSIANLVGTKFHVGALVKDGGPRIGKYEALIATAVYEGPKV